jgi:hypothetical protein
MANRILSVACLALGFVIVMGNVARSDDKGDKGKTHTGTVVSAKEGKLTMKHEGKEHSHDVPDTAKISSDGKECKLNDLKAGTFVRVTTDDSNRAVRVEADTKKKVPETQDR